MRVIDVSFCIRRLFFASGASCRPYEASGCIRAFIYLLGLIKLIADIPVYLVDSFLIPCSQPRVLLEYTRVRGRPGDEL